MTEERMTHKSVAPLRNVGTLVELVDQVQKRAFGLPGMATFHGPSGYGKSSAAVYAVNRFDALHIQIKSAWTAKKLCSSILDELGLPQKRKTIADMIEDLSDELAKSGRPLILDEADHLVARNMIEIVRDIYESSEATIILIGEELLPQKLAKWERVHGRMLDWAAAQPADLGDVRILADLYCKDVELDDEVHDDLLKNSNASIRRICVTLSRLRVFAVTRSLAKLRRKDVPKSLYFTGHAPAPRRISA